MKGKMGRPSASSTARKEVTKTTWRLHRRGLEAQLKGIMLRVVLGTGRPGRWLVVRRRSRDRLTTGRRMRMGLLWLTTMLVTRRRWRPRRGTDARVVY
jgi:hypothetical protein